MTWDDGWNNPWYEIAKLQAVVEKLEERIAELERAKDNLGIREQSSEL